MPLYMKMSQNINETTRHLKFRYISILTNLLRTNLLVCVYIYIYIYQSVLNGWSGLISDSRFRW